MAPSSRSNRARDDQPRLGTLCQIQGRQVHFLIEGEGEPVLLLHGNGGLGEEILAAFSRRRGVRWIAPDRPGYGYTDAAPPKANDPPGQARWAEDLLDALQLGSVHVVAHSIGCGVALCLASMAPHRVRSLTLINPFCRPTPHRWKVGLRAAAAPVIGPLLRPVIPHVLSLARNRVLARLAAPNPPPRTLKRLPLKHALKGSSIRNIAAELRGFNDGIERADPYVDAAVPVVAVFGLQDGTARPNWHGPWLKTRVRTLHCIERPGVGHMLHHVEPDVAWQAFRLAVAGREMRQRDSTPAMSASLATG